MATVIVCDRCKKEIREKNKIVRIRVMSEAINKLNQEVEVCDTCFAELAFQFQKGEK